MSLLTTQIEREKELEKKKNERIKNHKCNKCTWGTWTGKSYKCALPRCLKGLGNLIRSDKK